MKKTLTALSLACAVASLAIPAPAQATRYVPGSQCTTVIHRAKSPPLDEEQPGGIRNSLAWGWGGELDLRLTADNKLVMVHDNTLSRITGGAETRPVEQMTLAEVRRVRLARGGRIITFAQAVRAARGSGAQLLVEIKRHQQFRQRWDTVGFPAIAATLRELWMTDRVYIGGSGSVAYNEMNPSLPTFFRTQPGIPLEVNWVIDHGYDVVQLDSTHWDPSWVSAFRDAGIVVGSRQINDRTTLAAAYASGLRFFQSDRGSMVANWCQNPTPGP